MNVDSLQQLLKNGGNDTLRIVWFNHLAGAISQTDPDSAIKLCLQTMELAKQPATGAMAHGLKKGKAICYQELAQIQLEIKGDKQGLANAQEALKLWRELLPPLGGKPAAGANALIGDYYKEKGEKEKALRYLGFAAKCYESCGEKLGYALVVGNISNIYHLWGDIDIARQYMLKVMPLFDELGEEEKKAQCLISLSQIYKDKGNYSLALENAVKALKIFEKLDLKKRVAWAYQTICAVYLLMGNIEKGLEYCEMAFELNTKLKNRPSMVGNLINMSSIYANMGQYDKALNYSDRALKLMGEKNNPAKANLLCNVGAIYSQKSDYKKALEYFMASLEIVSISKDKKLRANLYGNIGEALTGEKKYAKAEEYFKKALQLDTIAGYIDHAGTMNQCLSDLYFTTSRYKESLQYYMNYSDCRDTVYSHQKNEEITRTEMSYEFEKKEAAEKALQEKKDAIDTADIKQRDVVFKWVSAVLVLITIFALLILLSLAKARKQKKLIELKEKETQEQKKIIESKNKDILDSIHYAKKIQTSLQPSEKFFDRNLMRLIK
jgi:tetratricopeptide (TPR) repeat protein